MNMDQLVSRHYSNGSLEKAILDALRRWQGPRTLPMLM